MQPGASNQTFPFLLPSQTGVPVVPARTNDKSKIYTSSEQGSGFIEQICTCFAAIFCFPCLLLNIENVKEYERAVIFRMGRLKDGGAAGPGIFIVIPCVDHFIKVDLRTVSFDIPSQEVLTFDSVTVTVDAVVYFRVSDPILAVSNVMNYNYSTRLLAASLLRSILGMQTLAHILGERERIAQALKILLDEATDPWGVKVERVELKDVRLPREMQRAMAAEAEAVREAKAKVVAAQGEANAAIPLKEAANLMANSPGALQVRYLQTLQGIAANKNFTVVFPMPVEVMKGLAKM